MKKLLCISGISALLSLPLVANGYELLGEKWPSRSTFIYSGSLSSTSNSAFREAVDSWNDSVPGFKMLVLNSKSHPCAGYTSAVPNDGSRNGVGFYDSLCGEPFDKNVLAVNFSQYSGTTVTESDIVFNSNESWSVYSGPAKASPVDFRRVAVHELGHFLGLGHEDSDGVEAIMAPYVGNIETPTADDIAGANAIYPASNTGGGSSGGSTTPKLADIVFTLEEPVLGKVASGISNIRGWAVGLTGINRIELTIDGKARGVIPYGGKRGDVQKRYSGYRNALTSGFSMVFSWNLLSPGSHTMKLVAYDNDGNSRTITRTFTVQRFDTQHANTAVPGNAYVSGRQIVLDNVSVGGKNYRVVLEWNSASQQFDPISITAQ